MAPAAVARFPPGQEAGALRTAGKPLCGFRSASEVSGNGGAARKGVSHRMWAAKRRRARLPAAAKAAGNPGTPTCCIRPSGHARHPQSGPENRPCSRRDGRAGLRAGNRRGSEEYVVVQNPTSLSRVRGLADKPACGTQVRLRISGL